LGDFFWTTIFVEKKLPNAKKYRPSSEISANLVTLPDWADFHILGNCKLLAVVLKSAEVAQIF
jgi:hypothetical protein